MLLKIIKSLSIVGVILYYSSLLLSAQSLAFQEKALKTTLQYGQRYVKFSYNFTNTGQAVIKITKVDLSCGCSSYELAKTVFASGENGVINVIVDTMNKGRKSGIGVAIETDEKHGIYILDGNITKPEYITASPRMLRWKLGEEMKEKRFLVSIKNQSKNKVTLYIKNIIANRECFNVRIEPLGDGKSYFIYVCPKRNVTCADEIQVITKPEAPSGGLSVIAYVGEKRDKL